MRVVPSLLSADFTRLADHVGQVEAAGAEALHFDVMDGHFVENISFGVPVMEKLRPATKLFFDTHLMIADPMKYAEPFAKAGSNLLTFHIETTKQPRTIIEHIRSLGLNVGITLNPSTPVSDIVPVLDEVDQVLIMSVWPGFGGQQFIESSLDKLREVRSLLRPDQRLEVDGGVGPDTVSAVVSAGADTLVAGSAIFDQPDPGAALKELENLARRVC
ncbi:MAG: ribulose-phosphate 3-epimerase [Planctomycetota bacterium]|nr:MAG: ribulose-phosphate 3-epimerase [Planctomycetota bacterium]